MSMYMSAAARDIKLITQTTSFYLRAKLHIMAPHLSLVLVTLSLYFSAAFGLQAGFYSKSCPSAEKLLFDTLKGLTANDADLPAVLLRLHFHDCFVRGCDASVLLDVANSEKTAPPNERLEGFNAVDTLKAAVEKVCPGVVSCADILAFAARDSVIIAGGPSWTVPAGRRDGSVSSAAEAVKFLPDAQSNVQQLVANFANQGLTKEDMVVLSGAHTIGEAACHHIDSRIYDYPSPSGVDPNIPADYAQKLKKKCRARNLHDRNFDLDTSTSARFDTQYYNNLVVKKGLLVSDQVLYTDTSTRPLVEKNRNQAAFFSSFGKAMVKMGNIRVLEGTQGQIRRRCRFVN